MRRREPGDKRPLTARSEAFCLEYMKDFNAVKAAIRAGYKRGAGVRNAYLLLTYPEISERVEALKAERLQQIRMSADEVLAGIARAARFDPRKLFDDAGRLKAVTELDEDTALALASVEVEEKTARGSGEDGPVSVRTRKLRAVDRNKALEMLARYHNLFSGEAKTRSGAMGQALGEMLGRAQRAGSGTSGLVAKKPSAAKKPAAAKKHSAA